MRMESDEPIGDAGFFPLFRAENEGMPDLTVRVLRQPLPQPEGVRVYRTNHRSRLVSDGTVYDYTFYSDAARLEHVPYACAVRHGAQMTLYIDYSGPLWDTMLFDAIGLPDFFLENAAAVIHASFIGVGPDGILFAGPKRQGKSTQAHLWNTYKNAVVINGDRVVIRETENGAFAYGVPFCGSSRLCVNTCRPIKAIVFPEKSAQNAAMAITPIESFTRLIGCVTYTAEDAAARDRAITFAERVASQQRCLRLLCRPDAGAVEALAQALDIS